MTEEMEPKHLGISYWLYVHWPKIKVVLVFAWIIIDALLLGAAFYNFTRFFGEQQSERILFKDLSSSLINFREPAFATRALPLELFEVLSIKSGDKYNLAARIENPNPLWTVESMDYYFRWSGGKTEKRKGYVLPGERFIVELGALSQNVSSPELVIENILWRKIESIDSDKVNLVFKKQNIEFLKTQKIVPNRLVFEIVNQTPYNFWNVGISVLMYYRDNLIEVGTTNIEQFKSQETRRVEVGLGFDPLPLPTKILIEPQVNTFDKDVFFQ